MMCMHCGLTEDVQACPFWPADKAKLEADGYTVHLIQEDCSACEKCILLMSKWWYGLWQTLVSWWYRMTIR